MSPSGNCHYQKSVRSILSSFCPHQCVLICVSREELLGGDVPETVNVIIIFTMQVLHRTWYLLPFLSSGKYIIFIISLAWFFSVSLCLELNGAIAYLERWADIVNIDIDFVMPLPPSNLIFVIAPIVSSIVVIVLEILPLCDMDNMMHMMAMALMLSTTGKCFVVVVLYRLCFVFCSFVLANLRHWAMSLKPLFGSGSDCVGASTCCTDGH